MTRLEALLDLYRLALQAPVAEHPEVLRAWLAERQRLLDLLSTPAQPTTPASPAPPATPTTVERALVAVVLHADQATHERLLRWRNRLGQHLRALKGRGLSSALPPLGRSRGFFG